MKRITFESGFSLLELIVVVVLLGVLAAGAGMLIANPIEAYETQQRRQQLVDQAEMALRQVASDVRRALPNSLRLNTVGAATGIEFVNTVDGARYRDEVDDLVPLAEDVTLDFTTDDTDFNLLGSFNSLTPASGFGAGHRLVIYNTIPGTLYQDAVAGSNPGIITPGGATLSLAASADYADEQHVGIDLGGGAGFRFAQQSPGQRLFVVDGPVSYVCDTAARELRRYSGYGYSVAQSLAPGGTEVTLATQVDGCAMTYDPGTSQRGGLLTLNLTIGNASGETVTLLHQVQVENVP